MEKTIEKDPCDMTIDEAMPELEQISKELNIPLNDWKVMQEWFRRHPKPQSKD